MNQISRLVLVLVAAAMLAGCVVVAGNSPRDREAGWQRVERENREQIGRLYLGMTVDQVRADMNPPDFSEAFEFDGDDYRVLFFRTHRVRADGMTTRDETTPLMFVNGVLAGWGEAAYEEVTGRPLAGL